MKTPRQPIDCDPTFSRNADGTRVPDVRLAAERATVLIVEPTMSDESAAVRRMMRSLERDFGAVIVEKTDFHRALDDAFLAGFQTTIDLRHAPFVTRPSASQRKARARNEKRLLRGYRPRHVRASV